MKYFKKSILFIFTIIISVFWSCTESEEKLVDNSIIGIISRTNDLSLLEDALNKTGLTETINSSSNYTLFAPTNMAFQNLLTSLGVSSLNDLPVPQLKEILLNHLLNGRFLASDFTTGYMKTLAKGGASDANFLNLFVNISSGVRLNGQASISIPNVLASNGIIHVVDEVITLPTVVTFASADPNFSTLVAALTRPDQPDFVSILSGTGPFTVFAPTNDAFSSLLTELGAETLDDIPQFTLENTLKYHVVSGSNLLSNTLANNQIIQTLQGQTFTVNISGNNVSLKDSNDRVSGVIGVDVQATNGVLHILNKVLLPN